MKNYPIIKSNEAVTVLFTAPRHGYILEHRDDHYESILYKSDWAEGAFSEVGKSWFKGKCIYSNNVNQNRFIRDLIFNHSGVVFPDADKARVFYLNNENHWVYSNQYNHKPDECNQLHIPFDEIFNVTTEFKGAPPSISVEDRYRASVDRLSELLAENERLRNNGDYILDEKQVWVINELINTSQLLIDQKPPVSPPIEWKETHEVKLNNEWWLVEPVFVSEVEMFFYDPIPAPVAPVAPAPINGVRNANLSVINLKSPDYRNREVGYLCVDDDGVLHPYDSESLMDTIKLCKNIL